MLKRTKCDRPNFYIKRLTSHEDQKAPYAIFIDSKQAYDSVNRNELFRAFIAIVKMTLNWNGK